MPDDLRVITIGRGAAAFEPPSPSPSPGPSPRGTGAAADGVWHAAAPPRAGRRPTLAQLDAAQLRPPLLYNRPPGRTVGACSPLPPLFTGAMVVSAALTTQLPWIWSLMVVPLGCAALPCLEVALEGPLRPVLPGDALRAPVLAQLASMPLAVAERCLEFLAAGGVLAASRHPQDVFDGCDRPWHQASYQAADLTTLPTALAAFAWQAPDTAPLRWRRLRPAQQDAAAWVVRGVAARAPLYAALLAAEVAMGEARGASHVDPTAVRHHARRALEAQAQLQRAGGAPPPPPAAPLPPGLLAEISGDCLRPDQVARGLHLTAAEAEEVVALLADIGLLRPLDGGRAWQVRPTGDLAARVADVCWRDPAAEAAADAAKAAVQGDPAQGAAMPGDPADADSDAARDAACAPPFDAVLRGLDRVQRRSLVAMLERCRQQAADAAQTRALASAVTTARREGHAAELVALSARLPASG